MYNLVGWSPKICSIHLCTILHHICTFKQATYKYQWESFLYLWPIQFQHKRPSQCYLLEPRIYPLSVLWSLLFLFLGPLYLPHSHSVPIRCWSRYSASSPPTHPTNTTDFLNLGQLIYILDSMSVRGLFGRLCLFVCSPSREIWTYQTGPASGKYCRVLFFLYNIT